MMNDALIMMRVIIIIILILLLSIIFIDWNFNNGLLRAVLFTTGLLVLNNHFMKKE